MIKYVYPFKLVRALYEGDSLSLGEENLMKKRRLLAFGSLLAAACLWAGSPAFGAVTTITIDDLTDNLTVTGAPNAIVLNETVTLNPVPGQQVDAHPPATAFLTIYLTEGATNNVSDTLIAQLTPNNDAATAQLGFTFTSDPETGLGTVPAGAAAAGQVFLEDPAGVNVTTANGINTRWRDAPLQGGNPITVANFPTFNQLVFVLKSDNEVPEPASLSLVAGAMGLFIRRRRAR